MTETWYFRLATEEIGGVHQYTFGIHKIGDTDISADWVHGKVWDCDWAMAELLTPPPYNTSKPHRWWLRCKERDIYNQNVEMTGYPRYTASEHFQQPPHKDGNDQWREICGVWQVKSRSFRTRCHTWNGMSGAAILRYNGVDDSYHITGVNKGNPGNATSNTWEYAVRINKSREAAISDYVDAHGGDLW